MPMYVCNLGCGASHEPCRHDPNVRAAAARAKHGGLQPPRGYRLARAMLPRWLFFHWLERAEERMEPPLPAGSRRPNPGLPAGGRRPCVCCGKSIRRCRCATYAHQHVVPSPPVKRAPDPPRRPNPGVSSKRRGQVRNASAPRPPRAYTTPAPPPSGYVVVDKHVDQYDCKAAWEDIDTL